MKYLISILLLVSSCSAQDFSFADVALFPNVAHATSGGGGGGGAPVATSLWHLDETLSDTAAVDSIGGVTLTAASANWNAGHLNNCYGVGNGTITYYLQASAGATTSLQPGTQDFSVNVWINTTDSSGNAQGIVAKIRAAAEGTKGGYAIFIDTHVLTAYYVTGAGPSVTVTVNESAVNDGNWHMVTMVAHRAGNLELWVDGVSVGTPASIASDSANSMEPNDDFTVAAYNDATGHVQILGFHGSTDELSVYIGHALTSGEISALYAL